MQDALGATGRRQAVNIVALYIFAGLVTITLLAVVSLGVLLYRGTLTHFVTASGTGYSRAGELSDAFVLSYAGDVVADRYNWSYLDIGAAHMKFKQRLHPSRRRHFEDTVAPAELAVAKQSQLTSMVVLPGAEIIGRDGAVAVTGTAEVVARDGFKRRVRAHGIRHLWTGGTLEHQDIVITMVLVPLIEQGAPSALRVWAIEDDHPLPRKAR